MQRLCQEGVGFGISCFRFYENHSLMNELGIFKSLIPAEEKNLLRYQLLKSHLIDSTDQKVAEFLRASLGM